VEPKSSAGLQMLGEAKTRATECATTHGRRGGVAGQQPARQAAAPADRAATS